MTSLTAQAVASARTAFRRLSVSDVSPVADDGSAMALWLRVPERHLREFAFVPGQHVTVRVPLGGGEVRRSYSVCSTPDDLARDGRLCVGIRVVEGGAFSSYAVRELGPGSVLEVLPPRGGFTASPDAGRSHRYAAVVAGSGVTPALSLVAHTLATEPGSTFAVLYGNRTVRSAMFLEELADLKNRYGARLQLLHFFSREDQEIGPAHGRLDAATLHEVLAGLLPPLLVDEWFVCGPLAMVQEVRQALAAAGVADAAVKSELFHAGPPPVSPATAPAGDGDRRPRVAGELTVHLGGRTSTVDVQPGQTVLEAALAARPELPYSCQTGVCATCRAKVVHGRAVMRTNWTLTEQEVADGYVLTCQAVPESAGISVDYDVM